MLGARLLSFLLCGLPLFAQSVNFRMQEIATRLGVVYAVTTADVNADGKRDIVAITNHQLLWFENPSWAKHVVAENITKADNVCVAPHDIDGDQKADFALGADWQSTNTTAGGSLHWVSNAGKVHDIATEPTLHRIGWADVDGDGRDELIVVPLHGRGAKAPDWTAGPGARILVFRVPANPASDPWPVEIADDSLHIVHNFIAAGREIWTASAEGVHALSRGADGKWAKRRIAEGKPGEIKLGKVGGKRMLATVEPWHGAGIVLYEERPGLWERLPIGSGINQGHALGWADFDGDGNDELAAGWRGEPFGLALYKLMPDSAWRSAIIDFAVAVEDLAIADLDNDGLPDLIAGGRATQNLRIYFNTTKRSASPISR